MKQRFDVTGMTCAACSARVEKATRAVDGVHDVSVNLLKNSMVVETDGSPEVTDAVVAAVEKAGYGAFPQSSNAAIASLEQGSPFEEPYGAWSSTLQPGAGPASDPATLQPGAGPASDPASTGSAVGASFAASSAQPVQGGRNGAVNAVQGQQRQVLKRLVASFVFAIPLFYLSMGHMFGWPLPQIFLGDDNLMVFALTQLLLLIPVLVANSVFFRNGFRSLLHGAPNMDSLIALGAGASTVYGVCMMYVIAYCLGRFDVAGAHAAAMDLYFESAALILALITLGKYFESRAKSRTTDSLSKLMDLSPKTAVRVVDGVEERVPAAAVRVGDTLVVRAGQSVPVDGQVLEGSGVVDESLVTGEPLPVDKEPGDQVTGGTVNASGWFLMEAQRVGADTTLAGIIRLVDEATSSKAPIEKLADRISGVFVPVVIGIALVTFIVWMVVGAPLSQALSYAISVLVISCPCALGLATPTAIMVGTGRGATKGILFKSAEDLEGACRVKTVVFDKTGTLTAGRPQVTDVVATTAQVEREMLALAYALERRSEHPLGRALVEFVEADFPNVAKSAPECAAFTQVSGQGLSGTMLIDEPSASGAPANASGAGVVGVDVAASAVDATVGKGEVGTASVPVVTCLVGNARMMEAEGIDFAHFLNQAERMADDGKTVLYVAKDGQVLGLVAIADKVKPTAKAAVAALAARGVRTVMLTGDNERTAHAVQRVLGVDKVVAGVLPEGKERVIRQLSDEGAVAMVGDGVNDAPALARADVGIAIGAGTDIAIESAGVVLMRSNPADVVASIDLSYATMRNIKQNLFWALFYNACCIPIAAGCFVAALGLSLNPMIAAAAMSFSSVCVVANALRLRRWDAKQIEVAVEGELVDAELDQDVQLRPETEDDKANGADHAEAASTLVESTPIEGGCEMEKTFNVEGMMCQNCVKHVTRALEAVDGVDHAVVDLEAKTATAVLSKDVPDQLLIAAIVEEGYEVV